jgi:hypothetical protein
MLQRALTVSGSGGGGGMTVETYHIADFGSYPCTGRNIVYYTVRTDYASDTSHIKGYVENGTLTEITTIPSIFSVSYQNGTLTVSKPNNSWAGNFDLYYFIYD